MNEFHIYGPPGTGKTTTLTEEAHKYINEYGSDEIVISSLTRAGAKEIGSRGLPIPDDHVGTLHSLCFHSLGQPQIAELKVREWNELHKNYPISIQGNYKEKDDLSFNEGKLGDQLLQSTNTKRAIMIPENRWLFGERAFYKKWCEWKESFEYMDFTDLIEQALEHTTSAPGSPSVLIGDECQDWCALELELFRKWGKKTEKILLAGDPDQSIYEWRGANPRVFMDNPVPTNNITHLKQSYRLPAQVHKYVRKWIKIIKKREDVPFKPTNEVGLVKRLSVSYKVPEALISFIKKEIAEGRNVMILASCGYMLRPMIALLRASGIPFHNPYNTKRGDWNPLALKKNQVTAKERVLAFLQPSADVHENEVREWTGDDLKIWMEVLQADGVLSRGVKSILDEQNFTAPPYIEELKNMFASEEMALAAIDMDLNWFGRNIMKSKKSAMALPINIAINYGGKELHAVPKVVVGTIHSVKGGEADTVILFPDLSKSAFIEFTESAHGRDHAIRTFYVGMTRAKQNLYLCDAQSMMAVDWLN